MSLGKHSIANLVGALVPMIVGLITVPLYLHYIGPERFGVLAVILALLGYFGFFDLGMGRAVTQRMARLTDAQEIDRSNLLWTALTASFLLGLLGSVVLWLGADYMLTHVINMSEVSRQEATTAVFWLLIALPLLLPASALTGALHARLRYFEVNVIQVTGGVVGQVLPLMVAMLGNIELTYLVPATLLARVLTILLLFKQCRIHAPLVGGPQIDRAHLTPMLGYGGWISVMSLLAPLLVTIDRLIIASLSGARAVASYTVPYDLVSRTMVISGSFSGALFPRLASASAEDGRLLACRASATLLAVMTPVTITGLFVAQPFLNLWVGIDFAWTSQGVAEVILIGVWINAIVIPHHARFLATDNPRTIVLIFVFEIPIYILMLWQGISHWGIIGAAFAWSTRVLIDTILLLRLNAVLADTLRATWPSLLLVTAAAAALVSAFDPTLQAALALMLITLSLAKDRTILLSTYRHIRPKAIAKI